MERDKVEKNLSTKEFWNAQQTNAASAICETAQI